jgi:hypothetical protein
MNFLFVSTKWILYYLYVMRSEISTTKSIFGTFLCVSTYRLDIKSTFLSVPVRLSTKYRGCYVMSHTSVFNLLSTCNLYYGILSNDWYCKVDQQLVFRYNEKSICNKWKHIFHLPKDENLLLQFVVLMERLVLDFV